MSCEAKDRTHQRLHKLSSANKSKLTVRHCQHSSGRLLTTAGQQQQRTAHFEQIEFGFKRYKLQLSVAFLQLEAGVPDHWILLYHLELSPTAFGLTRLVIMLVPEVRERANRGTVRLICVLP